MNRILSVPMATRVGLRRVSYRQDMPPPGGYPQMPWRRNIPQRGFGYIACLVLGLTYYFTDKISSYRWRQAQYEGYIEAQNLDMACMPLFEAEMDRDELRCVKEQIEGEAVNIVASGFDKNWKVGGYGIGENGPAEYWPSNGWTSAYNLAIFKNFGGERSAKMHSLSHQAQSINNGMFAGMGKHEHYGRGTD